MQPQRPDRFFRVSTNSNHTTTTTNTPPPSFYCHTTVDDYDDLLFACDGTDPPADVTLLHAPDAHPTKQPFSAMPGTPIDIATSRQSSHSPRTQQSNLTSQLQRPRIDVQQTSDMNGSTDHVKGRQESFSGMLGTTPYGARSIPVRGDQPRRESAILSGSYMNGMSWGGISMGSFIRDEYVFPSLSEATLAFTSTPSQ